MEKEYQEKKPFNRKEMVGEIQPPLIAFPYRDKEQLNTNIGSESSISLLRKDVLSIQSHDFTRKGVRVNQKSPPESTHY